MRAGKHDDSEQHDKPQWKLDRPQQSSGPERYGHGIFHFNSAIEAAGSLRAAKTERLPAGSRFAFFIDKIF
jgi:hypothetical protein